jgi:hypothetical protein
MSDLYAGSVASSERIRRSISLSDSHGGSVGAVAARRSATRATQFCPRTLEKMDPPTAKQFEGGNVSRCLLSKQSLSRNT